jgi:site-specific recombinase XerC
LYICELRRAEVASLNVESYDVNEGVIKVIGNGNKERPVFPDLATCDAIADWLDFRGHSNSSSSSPFRRMGKHDTTTVA